MSFDIERVFEDYALVHECACTRQELVEETTHHPVTAARYAADMVKAGTTTALDAAIRLYQDDWFVYDAFSIRFTHFYRMVCYLVK